METLVGNPSERTGSEFKSIFPVAGTVFSASLSAALLAFLTITVFMNDEFLCIFFLPNILDVLNFPFFGGVLLLITLYKFYSTPKYLLHLAQILNFIVLSVFGLFLIYFSGVYMEPWMSVLGQFYQMFPVFLALLLMTQTWSFSIHYVILGAYLTSLNPGKSTRKVYSALVGLILVFLNAFFWAFTQTSLLGVAILILVAGVVEISIWVLKDHANLNWNIQINLDLTPRFIKILLVVTLIYSGVYYTLSQLHHLFKFLLAFPAYLSIVFVAHKSPENTATQEESRPPRLRDEIKTHLMQKSLSTWAIGGFILASVVLSYGCPPLAFLGPFTLFFSAGLIAGLVLLYYVKTRSQHAYAQFCCGFVIIALQVTLMYVDNVINGYNYYSPEIYEFWPYMYLGSPWQGLLAGIGFALLFDVFYSHHKPRGNSFNYSINTVGWVLLLFFAIGLMVLLPNYNFLTYGGDVFQRSGLAPEVNASLFSDIAVVLYRLGIPILLGILFLTFSISHWKSRRTLRQTSASKEPDGTGGEAG